MPNVDVNGTVINFPDSLDEHGLQDAVSKAASQVGGQPQQNMSWKGLGNNALSDVKDIASSIPATVGKIAMIPKQMFVDTPMDMVQTGKQMFQGKPFMQTPMGQQAQQMGSIFKSLPQNVMHPYDHPVKAALDVASVAAPFLPEGKAATAAAGDSTPNFLETLGSKEANNAVGMSPNTLRDISKGANPGDVGAQVGTRLANEGAIGSSPTKTLSQIKALHDQFGNHVGNAMTAIKQAGGSTEIPDYEALQPLNEEITKLKGSSLQANRVTAKPFSDIYNKLVSIGNENQGNINIDHIRDAMQEVGEALGNAGRDTAKEASLSKLYGVLAKTRDSIVEKVANNSGNDALASNLRKANEGYSLYSQIMPDATRAAAREAVGSGNVTSFLKHPVDTTVNAARPLLGKGLIKAGGLFKKTSPLINKAIPAGIDASSHIEEFPPTGSSAPNEILFPDGSQQNVNQEMFKKGKPSVVPPKAAALPPQKKYLNDEKVAMDYYKKANGNKQLARQMAQQDGWTVV